jgi:hypothetical protein
LNLKVGQSVWAELPFPDGTMPDGIRPYLVVSVEDDRIGVLVVSSLHGKEHKLLMKSNYEIKNYKPPFNKPVFVKLDSLQYFPVESLSNLELGARGKPLDSDELQEILSKWKRYT